MIRMLAKDPVALIEHGAPHRIHDDETLARYTKALFCLTAKDKLTDGEQETIDLLTLLIEDYESKYRMSQTGPVEVLKYLMDKRGLRQQDLRRELGSISNISMILSGQRNLTLSNASALAARFNVDIRVFLPVAGKRAAQPEAGSARLIQAPARTNKRRTMSVRTSTTAVR